MRDEIKIELEKKYAECYNVYVNDNCLMELKQTCFASPEQYELKSLLDGRRLGYMRLRWSVFRCDYLDCGGETLLEEYIDESGWSGMFRDEEQRKDYLIRAIKLVVKKIRGEMEDE